MSASKLSIFAPNSHPPLSSTQLKMDARTSRSPAPRWPFFRRLRALLLVVARLSFHLPVATISAIRDRARPRASIQAASPAAAGMRVSRSEPSLLALAGDDALPEAAPRRAAGSGELAAAVSSPLARDTAVNADGGSSVFEYLDGGPVFPDDAPPVEGVGEERARRVFRDVSAALLYVHSQGVVHNDIKPANILCTEHGTAKLADFGVCQEVTSPDDLQRRSPGTPAFTAPECCTGEPFKGMAADTWALGCTLYAMVCGRHPFLGTSLMDTYDKIQSEPLILPPDMTPSLADLLTRLLHKGMPTYHASIHHSSTHHPCITA
ncbi:unnamed protein product [Closterium sp. Yama58-4]|nr:unnamed protein product [Closterium sp. Yama58-4]